MATPASPRAAAPQAADAGFEALAALVTEKMTEYGIPGVAFGVVKDGRMTLRGFGTTNVDNPQEMTPQTVFPIASISKTVTATAIMRLVEDGKLDLEAPVRRYLPEFEVQDPQPRKRSRSGTCSRTRPAGKDSSRLKTAASSRWRTSSTPACGRCPSSRRRAACGATTTPGSTWRAASSRSPAASGSTRRSARSSSRRSGSRARSRARRRPSPTASPSVTAPATGRSSSCGPSADPAP
jgi:hypothetical protein